LTAVHTEWDATENSCKDEEAKAPNPGHAAWNFSWEVVGLSSANWADQPANWNESLIVRDETLIRVVALICNKNLVSRNVVRILIISVVSGWRRWVIGS